MGDKKEEEDALGFLLDISEGGEEGESALSLLYDRFEGGEEENDPEAEGYPSFHSNTQYLQALKLWLAHQLLINYCNS